MGEYKADEPKKGPIRPGGRTYHGSVWYYCSTLHMLAISRRDGTVRTYTSRGSNCYPKWTWSSNKAQYDGAAQMTALHNLAFCYQQQVESRMRRLRSFRALLLQALHHLKFAFNCKIENPQQEVMGRTQQRDKNTSATCRYAYRSLYLGLCPVRKPHHSPTRVISL